MGLRRIFLASASWAILSADFAESTRSFSCEPWSFCLLVTGTMDLAVSCHHRRLAQKIEGTHPGMSQNFKHLNDLVSNANREFSDAFYCPGHGRASIRRFSSLAGPNMVSHCACNSDDKAISHRFPIGRNLPQQIGRT
jgi:hypothetical protein